VRRMAIRSGAKRMAVAAAAAPMLMAGLFAVSATTAQASPRPVAGPRVVNDCNETGRVCIWPNINFAPSNEKGSFADSNGNWITELGSGPCGGSWNDCISSVFNEKNVAVNLWQNVGDGGGSFCVPAETGFSNFTQHTFSNGAPLNDAVSADFVESGNSC
jgi:hypothetical protein